MVLYSDSTANFTFKISRSGERLMITITTTIETRTLIIIVIETVQVETIIITKMVIIIGIREIGISDQVIMYVLKNIYCLFKHSK